MRKPWLGSILLLVASLLVSSLVFDRVLGHVGFPAEAPFAHAPYLDEDVQNIEFRYSFRTNRLGLRHDDIPVSKPPGTRRVFVVGDSFTEGLGVEREDNFVFLLEQRQRERGESVEFINGGRHNRGPVTYARILFSAGMRYDPDGLLICVFANDLTDTLPSASASDTYSAATGRPALLHVAHSLWPRTYTLLQQSWETYKVRRHRRRARDFVATMTKRALEVGVSQARIDEWRASLPEELLEAVNRGRFNPALLSWGLVEPEHWIRNIDVEGDDAAARWRAMAEVLGEMVSRSRERGIEVGLVYIPDRLQYDGAAHESWNPVVRSGSRVRPEWLSQTSEFARRLKSWAGEASVPYLDLTATLREAVPDHPNLTFKLDGHWTPDGHRVAAEAISAWLDETPVFSFLGGKPPD